MVLFMGKFNSSSIWSPSTSVSLTHVVLVLEFVVLVMVELSSFPLLYSSTSVSRKFVVLVMEVLVLVVGEYKKLSSLGHGNCGTGHG